jgi:hypothetical protein
MLIKEDGANSEKVAEVSNAIGDCLAEFDELALDDGLIGILITAIKVYRIACSGDCEDFLRLVREAWEALEPGCGECVQACEHSRRCEKN